MFLSRMTRGALAAVIAIGGLGIVGPTLAPADAADALPACSYGDRLTRYGGLGDWYRSLVDTNYRLSSSYRPRDLVPVSRSGAPGIGTVRRFVIRDLGAMFRAARSAGAPFAVKSAYRSYRQQVGTFNSWIRRSGAISALLSSARPGHSEHQLGTTVDLTNPARVSRGRVSGVGKGPWLYPDWGRTPAGRWLRQNSWRYGFVLSYPSAGSPALTCYKYEAWHFRYFGRRIAAAIHRSGLTAREWLWQNGAAGRWIGGRA